jgi:DNA-binding MarR family transcriptional regulator
MNAEYREAVAAAVAEQGTRLAPSLTGRQHFEGGILYKLSRLQRLTRQHISKKIAEYGLSVPAFSAIVVVASSDPITNADLARASYVSPQTMNSIVVDLESRGVFQRTQAEVGRGLLIELTPTGELLHERLVQLQQELFELMVGESDADLERFSDTLSVFVGNLQALEDEQ